MIPDLVHLVPVLLALTPLARVHLVLKQAGPIVTPDQEVPVVHVTPEAGHHHPTEQEDGGVLGYPLEDCAHPFVVELSKDTQ